uniref:Uncharacterized protein n=1 Tax=Myoviridae sp. ctvns3 TaxID=2825204 RepID=A0A8S5PD50_9CAUD|nr:MAG TPA: hypothetical protein [Myoviridae sp. ctvns3]
MSIWGIGLYQPRLYDLCCPAQCPLLKRHIFHHIPKHPLI